MIEIDTQTKDARNKKYNEWARTYPSLIGISLLIVLGVLMGLNDKESSTLVNKAIVYVLSISTVSSALFFLYRTTLRDISKFYPGKILFCDRLKPTTRMLYSADTTFSEDEKKLIRLKIKEKNGRDLQSIRKKSHKNKKYVKSVDEVVSWLLDVTRFDDILFEYNCFFGFYRNLTAAVLVDSIVVFILAAVSKWCHLLPLGSCLLWIALVLLLCTAVFAGLAYINGNTFARRVYTVFMNLGDDDKNYNIN